MEKQSNIAKIYSSLQEVVDEKKLKKKMATEARVLTSEILEHQLLRPGETLEKLKGIKIEEDINNEEYIKYQLILDFLISSQFSMVDPTLQYESQNPTIQLHREAIAKKLGLKADSPTPLLVQLIIKRKKKAKTNE